MKKLVLSCVVLFTLLLSCNKDPLKTDQEVKSQVSLLKSTSMLPACKDLCFIKSRVCLSPIQKSWVCSHEQGGWFFQEVGIEYVCDGAYKYIPITQITNSTPISTICFDMNVPINIPIRVIRKGGCNHDHLCNFDVSITTGLGSGTNFQCTTTSTFIGNSNGWGSTPWFTACSKVLCYIESNEVK